MNELLRQLLAVSPAIGAGVSGQGPEANAFMEGFLRTSALMQENKRRNNQDQLAQQDRERLMTRQTEADRIAAQDRARQGEVNKQQDFIRSQQAAGGITETASAFEDPAQAKAYIESMMPNLMSVFGQGSMALGQPAVDIATQTITGRQKKQIEQYVKAAAEATANWANDPSADPELVELPDHIVRIVGKPSAKLSELQRFAQLPVGKPAGKTRVPAAAGSFEDFVQRKYGENPTADQILEGRKAYQQSDDKPTVNVTLPGGVSPAAGNAALKFQDDYARDSKPYLTMREAYQRVRSAASKPDAAGDLSMIFAYMKMLDPNSVVREQEFANAQNAAGVPDRVRNLYNRVMQGNRLNPVQREQFVAQADALFENAKTNQRGVRGTYSKRAQQFGVPEAMVLDDEDEFLRPAPFPPAGTRRKAPDGTLVESDGKGWIPVRP